MKKLETVGATLLTLTVLLLGVSVSAAQTPTGTSPTGVPATDRQTSGTATPSASLTLVPATVNPDDPNRAEPIDNLAHTLAPNQVIWYRFDYANNHMTGQRPLVVLTLVNGNNSGVDVQVYSPEIISQWWEKHPIGRTTIQLIDCETGDPSESGECVSNDLLWKGNFGADGTYWARVVNTNSVPVDYTLTINTIQPIAP